MTSRKYSRAGIGEADEFYERITPQSLTEDQRRVHRQALAGMLWSKQFYYFDLDKWLEEHRSHPLLESARHGVRNTEWFHMLNADVISMPDKWEYPWYAAWDLAFHTIALSQVDFDFAKEQLLLMLRNLYFHPNGQIPAYEWNFSDVNPPVHAWATLWLYKYETIARPVGSSLPGAVVPGIDAEFQLVGQPQGSFRKERLRRRISRAGQHRRLRPQRGAAHRRIVWSRRTGRPGWRSTAIACVEIALILCDYDPMYEEVAFKFVQHFMWISYAMDRIGEHHDEMWDEQDGFFYDLLRLPDGQAMRLKVRSLVGLLPLCASTVFEGDAVTRHPKLMEMIALFRKRHPELVSHVAPTDEGYIGHKGRRLMSILNKKKLVRVLGYMLDENEFLGPHGIRSHLPVSPGSPVHLLGRSSGVQGAVPAGRIEYGDVRRQLQLARSGVDAGQRADRPGAGEPLQVLRRRIQGGVPNRFRQVHDAVRGGAGTHAAA